MASEKSVGGVAIAKLIQLIKSTFFKKSEAIETYTLDIDDVVTEDSGNLVTSGAVFEAIQSGGSGLPEVEGSGKALVSVNGEWVVQDGYGYEIDNRNVVVWDGNIEGREHEVYPESPEYVSDFYKVSDIIPTYEDVVNKFYQCNVGEPYQITEDVIIADTYDANALSLDESIYVIPTDAFTFHKPYVNDMYFEKAGLYFWRGGGISNYVSNFTFGNQEIHKIDAKYIPDVSSFPADDVIVHDLYETGMIDPASEDGSQLFTDDDDSVLIL